LRGIGGKPVTEGGRSGTVEGQSIRRAGTDRAA
jgi:hypothetical protein